jgi:potassium efflux system protein
MRVMAFAILQASLSDRRGRMNVTRSMFVVGLLVVLNALPVCAQTTPGQDDTVGFAEVRRLRTKIESDPSLREETRVQILELYDIAIRSLETATDHRAAAEEFSRERGGIDRMVEELQSQLEHPEPTLQLPLSPNPTIEEAEDALARERARFAANRNALRNQERLAEDRAKSRSNISKRLGELDLEREQLNDELRRNAGSAAPTELKNAVRVNLLARREAALSETEMLRAQLALINEQSSLIPLETDLAQRRLSYSRNLVDLLEAAAHDLRVELALEALGRVREQSEQLSEELPSIAPIAAETVELAELLWSPDGAIARSERTVIALERTRHHQAQLNRIADLTTRKYEAYGHRGSLTRWWPDVPEDFPEPGSFANVIQDLDKEIPEVEHRLITLEQQRSRAHDLARQTMIDLQDEFGGEMDPELAQRVRDLLTLRQGVLDQLIMRVGDYSNRLLEYRTASDNFLRHVREVERFLFSHVLWSRSVPRPIIPRPRSIGEAFVWLLSTEHLAEVGIVRIDLRTGGILAALLLVSLVLLRQPMRRRLSAVAAWVNDPERDKLGFTAQATVLTVLLAAPLPLALYLASSLAERLAESTYWHSSADALAHIAMVAALLELVRQVFAPRGLAEAHFSWPTGTTRPLYRGLLMTEAIGLPMLYVALHLAFAGMRLDSPDNLQLYNNSLGRIMFIAATLFIGLSILAMLRPEKKEEASDREMRVPWPRRFSEYAFPTAFLGAYPLIILTTVLPAILATFGFYVTGILLAYQMLRTLLLALVVMVGGGLVHRWRIVNRNRAILDSAGEKDEAKHRKELEATEAQVLHLHRFVVVMALAIGLLYIWSDALPMLESLRRVQLLPRVQMLDPIEESASMLGAPTEVGEAPTAEGADSTAAGVPGAHVPGAALTGTAAAPQSTSLTLWHLLEAIIAGVFTLVLVRNLPGIIDIILKRRTHLDSGARFAFSTLVRYSITIIGTVVVFGLLGITWNKVQWLAAALTFGLGFGLQEIVANFVSGLILLVERPVRVGDVVTIGNLMGTVTRIQIRATTITLWDRSEMIVPNKEFITTKLVNWTLSDSKRRIEIPIRITYGTDLELVKKILVDAAEQHPSVLDDPAPQVLLLSFGDDAINLELRFVVDFGQGLSTKDQVQMTIDRAFREQGIEFALPKSEVRFISDGAGSPEAVDPATG